MIPHNRWTHTTPNTMGISISLVIRVVGFQATRNRRQVGSYLCKYSLGQHFPFIVNNIHMQKKSNLLKFQIDHISYMLVTKRISKNKRDKLFASTFRYWFTRQNVLLEISMHHYLAKHIDVL